MYVLYTKIRGISLLSKTFFVGHCYLSSSSTGFFLEAVIGKLFLIFVYDYELLSGGQSWSSLFPDKIFLLWQKLSLSKKMLLYFSVN